MNIKDLKPTQNGHYTQGYFYPKNPDKYIGHLGKIIYRSSYEKKFMDFCDMNPMVIKWSSEPVSIKYVNSLDGKPHEYWVDFWMKVLNNGVEKEYLIEVKPNMKLKKPNVPLNQTNKSLDNYKMALMEHIKNTCKFHAAVSYAQSKGMEFRVVTENFLFNK